MRSYAIAVFLCLSAAVFYGMFHVAAGEPNGTLESKAAHEAVSVATYTARFLFVGDVMLGRDVERKLDRHGLAHPYSYVKEITAAHKYVVANFEASVPREHRATPNMSFAFSVRDDVLAALVDAGFTHLSLANNHSFDHGKEGYDHSIERITAHGAVAFGSPHVIEEHSLVLIDSGATTTALIGVDLTSSRYETDELRLLFHRANRESDLQIVYVHWGEEYKRRHSVLQEEWATWFVKRGADLIIGHHPHVVQDVGQIDGVPVFYSLGNFIFDQYFSEDVMTGLALSVDALARRVELIPVTSRETLIAPRPLEGEEKAGFLRAFAERSDENVRQDIEKGSISF